MGWLDSILGGGDGSSGITDLFSGGSGNFGDGNGGWFNNWGLGSTDGNWTDLVDWTFGGDGGNSLLSGVDWSDLAGTGGDSGGGVGGYANAFSKLLGNGAQSGGLMQSLLGGLGGAADAYLGEKAMRERGKQDRLSIGYAADLQDYYQQLNKQRKRLALDTYGQYSLLRGGTNTPAVQVPAKPNPGG